MSQVQRLTVGFVLAVGSAIAGCGGGGSSGGVSDGGASSSAAGSNSGGATVAGASAGGSAGTTQQHPSGGAAGAPVTTHAGAGGMSGDSGTGGVPSAGGASGGTGGGTLVPAQVLDLSHFTLTIPTQSDGTEGGYPAQIIPNSVLSPAQHPELGYSSKYFYASADANGSSVTFWCPISGAANSVTAPHPRTELRHQVTPGKNDGWLLSSPVAHTLDATLSVSKVPPGKGTIIIGQIHGLTQVSGPGAGKEASPLLLISFIYDFSSSKAKVTAEIKGNPDGTNSPPNTTFTLLSNVNLGDPISYKVSGQNSVITVNGVATPLSAAWAGVQGYFKAGAYVQTIGTDATQGGIVTFQHLVAVTP